MLRRMFQLMQEIARMKDAIAEDVQDFGTTDPMNRWYLQELINELAELMGG